MDPKAEKIIKLLQLQPHPEGGFYREIYRSGLKINHPVISAENNPVRSAATGIYFLIPQGSFSAFHRVKCSDETWHFYDGGPLELHLLDTSGNYEKKILTNDLDLGEPVFTVKAGLLQAARLATGGSWVLCGCTVSPGFDFADFEMPQRDELLKKYPAVRRDIIEELTRV